MDRNGYFQLIIKPTGTYIKLYPAEGAGDQIRFEEIVTYLLRQRVSGYQMAELNKAVKEQKETEVKLLDESILPVQEEMNLVLSQDKMEATVRFYPPSNNSFVMEKPELLRGIAYQGVKYGLQEEVVDEFIERREYCKDYVIAKGTPVQEGSDAEITYHFNLNPSARPKLNEDGSVDFHKLENINAVTEGMVLATLKREVQGLEGRDVCGVDIKPKAVAVKRLLAGKNTYLIENDTRLVSAVNGHVILDDGGKVVVSDIYEIKGDVDTSTGDINYDGDVKISGNVLMGFSVTATGDVEVEGVVEAAKITAGGKLVIKHGVQGMNKGVLQAGGDVLCRFIESAIVTSGGNIETDAIMHSDVSAKGEIHVSGKKGLIVGGNVRAGRIIEAVTVGSAMGSSTALAVGDDPQLRDRIKNLEEENKRLTAEENKLRQVLEAMKQKKEKGQLTPDRFEILQKAAVSYGELKTRIEALDKELSACYEEVAETEDARIIVRNIVYSGVKLMVGGEFTITNSEYHFCKFVKDWHEIKRISL